MLDRFLQPAGLLVTLVTSVISFSVHAQLSAPPTKQSLADVYTGKSYSPYAGRIIGMARNQVVMPGFAAFHVGIEADTPAIEETPVDIADKSAIGGYVDGMSE